MVGRHAIIRAISASLSHDVQESSAAHALITLTFSRG